MFKALLHHLHGEPLVWVQDAKTGQIHGVWQQGDAFRCNCSDPWGRCDHIEIAKQAVLIEREAKSSAQGTKVSPRLEREESESIQVTIQDAQEQTSPAARVLIDQLMARIKKIEAENDGLTNKLDERESGLETLKSEVAQNNQRQTALKGRIKELKAERVELVNDLARAEARASQVSTQLDTRILVDLLTERIKEITAENARLEHRLTSAKSKARQATQACSDLEARVGELGEKNTRLEQTLNEREKEISVLKADVAQNDPTALKSRIETLERAAAFPHLKFGPDAERDYAKLSGKDLQTVNKKLALLDRSALEWCVKGGAKPLWHCEVKDESDTVKEGKKLSEKRRFWSYLGTKELFMLHANIGNKRRIHLRIDPSKREVEIGYIGDHLSIPTA